MGVGRMTKILERTCSKRLTKEFRNLSLEIADYLNLPKLAETTRVFFQNKSCTIEVFCKGKNFGVIREGNHLVLANWLTDLPQKAQEALIDFLLTKETFRDYFESELASHDRFTDLLEIILGIMAILWLINRKGLNSYRHKNIGFIQQRIAFTEKDPISRMDWEYYSSSAFYNEISVLQLYGKLRTLVKKGLRNNSPQKELIKELDLWFKSFDRENNDSFFPIKMRERHYDIFEALRSIGFAKSSAKNIGAKLGLKHDVINTAFKEMSDLYLTFWHPQINFLKLKLYPFIFRVNLPKASYKNKLLAKLREVPYCNNILEGGKKGEQIIFGSLKCPLIIHNQLQAFFENMAKQDMISDYFFKTPRRRTLFSSVILTDSQYSIKSYRDLMNNPAKYGVKTYTLLDELIDITKSPKRKKTIFDPNVLGFLAILRGRLLNKGDYGVYVPEFIELLEMNQIDSKDTTATMRFINQFEHRCKRLGLLKYHLTLWKKSTHRTNLYCEILVEPNNEELLQLIDKFKLLASLTKTEFLDRVLLTFQGVSGKAIFRKAIEQELKQTKLPYTFYKAQYLTEFQKCIPYHKLYDFEKHLWTF